MSNIVDRELLLSDFVEVQLVDESSFLKVRETLTRIGLTSRDKTLNQTCYLLHKKGKYYICHFMELFAFDGRPSNFTEQDRKRRNRIAYLLEEWGQTITVNKEVYTDMCEVRELKVIPYKEKEEWNLRKLYSIGKKFSKKVA